MKRVSPDAGRRRARQREAGAAAEVAPLCAAGVLAAATMVFNAWAAPASWRTMEQARMDACPPQVDAVVHGAPRG